jgi:hypothetical protein
VDSTVPQDDARVEAILEQLAERDVATGHYPTPVVSREERRRWNQAILLSLAIYYAYVPSMLVGEYSQERFALALSIYRQDRDEFPTGSDEELADEIASAVAQGWL